MSAQPTRSEGVVLLLEQRGCYTPAPEGADAKRLRLSAKRGESPGRRESCEECDGTGKKRGNLCWRCLGKGSYDVDDYTGAKVLSSHDEVSWATLFSQQKPARCSACAGSSPQCSRCNGTGLEPGPTLLGGRADLTGGIGAKHRKRTEPTGDPGLDMLRRHDQILEHPAQQALSEALTQIAPPTRMLVEMVYVDGLESEDTLMAATRQLVQRTVTVLAELMPTDFLATRQPRLELPVEVWASWKNRAESHKKSTAKSLSYRGGKTQLARNNQAQAHREIRQLHIEGWNRQRLAHTYGYSYSRICEIVREAA